MPAFTAVGAYVAGTIFGLVGTAAIVVGAIVAVGAAYITSRVINGNPNKGGNASAASQGGRIQVPPATNNKIPVLYGTAYVNGIITDARLISTDQKTNNTMFYCIVLSETCNAAGATYDVNNIYWNDLRLTQVDSTTNAHKIKDGRKTVDGPGEDFIDTNFVVDGNSLVEVRVYAGSSAANKQIFPSQASSNTQAAYDFWGNNDNSWTSSFDMKGLVFAIVKVTYNGEKGFTALPNMTFDVTNSLSNPADVWYDYMTGVRYGAGIPGSDINISATTTWQNFCNEDINYTDIDGVTTQSTERYKINGLLDTTRSVKENIDIVLQNGGAWMSYDVSTGLWSPLIKKAITAGDPTVSASHFTGSRTGTQLTVTAFPEGRIEAGQELYDSAGTLIGTITAQLTPTGSETAGQKGRYTTSTSGSGTATFYTTAPGLLSFSDDNIISGISISSTRLDDLYNSVEAEFYDQYNKDQKAYARNEINAGERNPNEPDNQLRMSLDLCNNSMQADILGQMELRQSRDDLVIDFTSNHYGIQTQAGDIVNVYSELYDWAPKLFRVMRVKEQETEEGGLVAQIQAMEYNGDVYTIEPITEFTTEENIGIGVYGASPNLPPPPDVIIAAIDADVAIPNFQLQVTIPTSGGPYDEIELYYTEGWDEMTVTGSIVPGTGSNGAPVGKGLLTITSTPQGHINPGDRINSSTGILIESQIANNPVSKTFVSGGQPVSVNPATTTSRLITLNDVTGLLVGHTLTGTGIVAGTFILEINPTGSPANTVRIENAVTVQAAGTYAVTGGLGTYIVDTSTTLSGSLVIYDFPEADNYKLLKKITPEGNTATFTNGEIINDIITTVPANSATYRRWFIKARMGIKKRFGSFSNPGATDYNSGRFPYKPSPTGGGSLNDLSDVSITSAEEGDFLWYNGIEWINTNEPTVDTFDRTLRLTKRYSSTVENYETEPALKLNGRVSDAVNDNTNDAGPAIRFERSSGAEYTKTWVSGGAIGAFTVTLNNVTGLLVGNKVTGTGLPAGNGALITVIAGNQLTLDTAFTVQAAGSYIIGAPVGFGQLAFDYFGTSDVHRFRVLTSTDNFLESPVDVYPGTSVLIDSTKNYTNINDDVLYVDAVNNRVGVNITSPQTDLHVAGSALIDDNLTVTGSTFLGNNYILDETHVIGEFKVTNNTIDNLFVDRTTGYVGINDNTPSFNLDINGNLRATGAVQFDNTLIVAGNVTASSDLAVNGGDITSTASPFNLLNQPATVNAFTASTATLIGAGTGTTSIGNNLNVKGTTLTLNSDGTGTEDITILFERGGAGDTSIKYNETTDRFEFASPITTLTNLGARFSQDLFGTGYHGVVVAGTTGDVIVGGDFYFQRNGGTYPSNNASIYVDRAGGATDSYITWNESTVAWDISNSVTIADNLNVASGVLVVDDTNNRVGVNTATPTKDLDVVGEAKISSEVTIGNSSSFSNVNYQEVRFETYNFNANTSVPTQIGIDLFVKATYRSARYSITMTKGSDYQMVNISIIHDGTTAYMTVSDDIATGANIATFSVAVDSTHVVLDATVNGTVNFKWYRWLTETN